MLLSAALVFIVARRPPTSRPSIAPPRSADIARKSAQPGGAPSTQPRSEPKSPGTRGLDSVVDICGFGKVPLDATDGFAAARYLEKATSTARSRWIAALLDSDDLRARAAGLFLEGKLSDNLTVHPMKAETRDALVQIAVGAGDPAIYAMAVYACNTYFDRAPADSCAQITLDAWSRLDPGNAVPWLLLVGKAQANSDAVAEAAAFTRAAKAGKVDAYDFSLYAYAEPEMPDDMTPLERAYLATGVIGIEAATASMQYGPATKYCAALPVNDGGIRQQQCDALAELLVGKGTNLVDLGIGRVIGTHTGWSAKRIAGLKEEFDALMQASSQATGEREDGRWSCPRVRRFNAFMSRLEQQGEVGAAREALESSGLTVAELARMQRDFLEKLARVPRNDDSKQ